MLDFIFGCAIIVILKLWIGDVNMKNLKNEYSESEKKYWKNMSKFYKENKKNIKKSDDVIYVDFKTKKIINVNKKSA